MEKGVGQTFKLCLILRAEDDESISHKSGVVAKFTVPGLDRGGQMLEVRKHDFIGFSIRADPVSEGH